MKTAVVLAFLLFVSATNQSVASDATCVKKPGDTTAKLSWSAPASENNISHYSVVHILPDGSKLDYIGISKTSLVVPLLERGVHRFTVRSHTRDDKVSGPSASVCKEI